MRELGPLYPILDCKRASAAERERLCRLAMALADGGAGLLQLRAKTLATGFLVELAGELIRSLAPLGGRLIVNDRVDVAMACGAAGVHLGDQDIAPAEARALLGPGAIVGYSTHAVAEARAANSLPVDYLGFGPVFESPTKAGAREPRGIDALAEACHSSVLPIVAIGGLDMRRAPAAWAAGARAVAVISEIERDSDPRKLVKAYLALAARTQPISPSSKT